MACSNSPERSSAKEHTIATIYDVAEAFIADRGRHGRVGTMALQRLCYLAQGIHLAMRNAPLFEAPLLAWPYGPANPELHEAYGDAYLPKPGSLGDASRLTQAEEIIVESVASQFSHLDGRSLGEMTMTHLPWIRAHERATVEDACPVLEIEDMRLFFRAWIDAPKTSVDYANRFAGRYAETTEM